MSQTSIASYFATRKRAATDDANIVRAKKVLLLDPSGDLNGSKGVTQPTDNNTCDVIYKKEISLNNNESTENFKLDTHTEKELKFPQRNRVVTKLNFDPVKITNTTMAIKKAGTPKSKPRKVVKEIQNQPNIQSMFNNIQQGKIIQNTQEANEKTPPTTPVKNALDNLQTSKTADLSLNEIKNKLTRSSRLAELKASLSKFNKNNDILKQLEMKNSTAISPSLKTFKTIDIEVQISPKKLASPVKSYLSPKKDILSPRKNLFGLLSPTKHLSSGLTTSPSKAPAYQRFQALASPGKPSLTLPFKYRSLAEMFRSIDTVCAMLFNRKETITLNKLKPAVQEMMRRNLSQQHFAQMKALYPDAFTYNWEKKKSFGSKQEKFEFVVNPIVTAEEGSELVMNPTCLLDRRRKLFNALLERVKDYHNEFLMSLDPPMVIPREKITRWHPEFDIEKVPDIEGSELPPQPEEEKMTTGQEVLERSRTLFNCNTRMEKALEKLKQLQENKPAEENPPTTPVPAPLAQSLKGIPKVLLEKIRAKQAAKALDAMTRSANQDKETMMYSRLPEIARLMRNTFVAEKKGVLPLEEVIIKLNNSYRSFLTNAEIEEHLRLISKVVPGWLIFHEVRRTLFVKVSRDGDMGKVMKRLEELAKLKCGA